MGYLEYPADVEFGCNYSDYLEYGNVEYTAYVEVFSKSLCLILTGEIQLFSYTGDKRNWLQYHISHQNIW